MVKTRIVFLSIVIFLFFSVLQAENTGHVAGKVKSVDTERGLEDVLVTLTELERTTRTDEKGDFFFKDIPAGTYSISFMAPGYGKTVLLNVFVGKGQTWYDQVYLQKSEQEGERFYIGGIEVTAEKELLPEETATTTRISSGEIEHIQASSLGDVLELIPGQKFTNPGLGDVKQVTLRQTSTTDDADRNASLGTQVLMDGVPLSNNANMQLDTDLNQGGAYRVTTNAGIDLRRIPADNIQDVEVIRGIPSAKYGDLTSGAIIVNTKSGYTPYRAKYKYNPNNQEMNLGGGYQWENHDLNFNLNYARSLRNIRVEGDSYSRISGQLNLFSYFIDRKLLWSNRFAYTQTMDEQDLREGDITLTERYNRSFEGRYSGKLQYDWSEDEKFSALFSVNLNRENSYIKRLVSRDLSFIGVRMEDGVDEGYLVVDYISKLYVKGRAWNIFGQMNYNNKHLLYGMVHKWQIGMTGRYEFNNGPGREFDPRYPPRSSANEGDRPRPYDDIPGLTQLAFYAEDEITGHLFRDYSLQLGLRYDLLGFRGLNTNDFSNFIQSDHGNFFNPRINFVYYLGKNTQLRMGYGRTVKSPPLSMIYPNPVYFDVVDSSYIDTTDIYQSTAIINTHVFERNNTKLKGFTRDKYEASIDRRIGMVGLSLTGFYERSRNGFELGGYYPVSLYKYYRSNWPDPAPTGIRDTILLHYNQAINSVESKSRGIELAVTTKRIESLSTKLRIDAAYHFSDSWWQDNHYQYGSRVNVSGFDDEIIPFWNSTSRKSEELVVHYRFDTLIKPLRLWFTLNIQQVAFEKDKYTGLGDSLAVGYISRDGQRHYFSEAERADPKYENIRRAYEDYQFITETRPNLWLINLRVSKELWKGSEVSFFVNNLFNYRPLYRRQRVPEGSLSYVRRNPEIFYGIEFSTVVDDFIDYVKRF